MEQQSDLREYQYPLPTDRIALYPLPERDQSKLLVYKEGEIIHSHFYEIDKFLTANSILFFNDTKVIPARLLFQKQTGATIEIFLLNPLTPSPLVSISMEAKRSSRWQVVIGNAKRWPVEQSLDKQVNEINLQATCIDRENGIVEFSWEPVHLSFAEVIAATGATPLPPYLKREAEASDRERYQTIYSKKEGAVAAPTAGLHFTTRVFAALAQKNISTDFLTLHVSAGTFQPIKTENITAHHMHAEQLVISKSNLENLVGANGKIIAVGTTSVRTLESLYWYGVKLKNDPDAEFIIFQEDPIRIQTKLTSLQAFGNVLEKLNRDRETELRGETSIYIYPGYRIRTVDAIITNFHQPGSTLMLLIATLVGEDWKKIYQEALANDYRFLSYGDSSLLFTKSYD
jgi:S-adenosylmethionine:tRNA ribosyltransferase-isomerase